jgi:fluoride exporter
MLRSIAVISAGASTGAVLRWLLGSKFNSLLPSLPLGTLLANLLGGYLIGVAIAFLGNHPSIAPEWRLLIITGFLGGLTTFSTFSAETTSLLQQGRMVNALALIAVHVLGSLALTAMGMWSVSALRG